MTGTLALSLLGVAGQGCGSTSSPAQPDAGPQDSGMPDVKLIDSAPPPDTTAPDTATMMDTAIPPCPIEASIETTIVPDAAIPGGDASIGSCLNCSKQNCLMQEMACDVDCACKEALLGLVNCIQGPSSGIESCALKAIGTEPNAFALGECILGNCVDACGLNALMGGGDSGQPDGPSEAATSDGSTEAGEAGEAD